MCGGSLLKPQERLSRMNKHNKGQSSYIHDKGVLSLKDKHPTVIMAPQSTPTNNLYKRSLETLLIELEKPLDGQTSALQKMKQLAWYVRGILGEVEKND